MEKIKKALEVYLKKSKESYGKIAEEYSKVNKNDIYYGNALLNQASIMQTRIDCAEMMLDLIDELSSHVDTTSTCRNLSPLVGYEDDCCDEDVIFHRFRSK